MWLLSLKITEIRLRVCSKLCVAVCRWSALIRSMKQSSISARYSFWCMSRTHGFSTWQPCHPALSITGEVLRNMAKVVVGCAAISHWVKFTLLQLRYNQDWNLSLTKDLQNEPVFSSLSVNAKYSETCSTVCSCFFFPFPPLVLKCLLTLFNLSYLSSQITSA